MAQTNWYIKLTVHMTHMFENYCRWFLEFLLSKKPAILGLLIWRLTMFQSVVFGPLLVTGQPSGQEMGWLFPEKRKKKLMYINITNFDMWDKILFQEHHSFSISVIPFKGSQCLYWSGGSYSIKDMVEVSWRALISYFLCLLNLRFSLLLFCLPYIPVHKMHLTIQADSLWYKNHDKN